MISPRQTNCVESSFKNPKRSSPQTRGWLRFRRTSFLVNSKLKEINPPRLPRNTSRKPLQLLPPKLNSIQPRSDDSGTQETNRQARRRDSQASQRAYPSRPANQRNQTQS